MKMVLAAGLLTLSAFTAAHSATVVNGSFEDSFANTTYSGGAGFMNDNVFGSTNSNGYANTPDGSVAGFINSGYNIITGANTGSIGFQLTDLVVGQGYTISFADALSSFATYTANPFTVSYNGLQIGSFSANSTSWTSGSTGVFNATGTTGTLTFTGSTLTGLGTTRSVGIDSVAISAASGTAAVPEPATWAMMIGGFGMVGGALRRRRADTSLALS